MNLVALGSRMSVGKGLQHQYTAENTRTVNMHILSYANRLRTLAYLHEGYSSFENFRVLSRTYQYMFDNFRVFVANFRELPRTSANFRELPRTRAGIDKYNYCKMILFLRPFALPLISLVFFFDSLWGKRFIFLNSNDSHFKAAGRSSSPLVRP